MLTICAYFHGSGAFYGVGFWFYDTRQFLLLIPRLLIYRRLHMGSISVAILLSAANFSVRGGQQRKILIAHIFRGNRRYGEIREHAV